MLVIISDLHFVDESAGKHNLNPKAYKKVLDSLNAIERFNSGNGKIKEVVILFLGDIFDVVRSQNWFEALGGQSASLRPWGKRGEIMDHKDSRILKKTRAIFYNVIHNGTVEESCKVFTDWKDELHKHDVPVKFFFIPGNHDRFLHVHVDKEARIMAKEALGLDGPVAKGFPRWYKNVDYNIVAFHGHETDLINFASKFERNPWRRVYGAPSIGEAITLEIVTRIPYLAKKYLEQNGYSSQEIEQIIIKLLNLDNVRPVEAVFPWLQYQAQEMGSGVEEILDEVVKEVFSDFSSSKFVKKWSKNTDQSYIPSDTSAVRRLYATLFDIDFDEYIGRINKLEETKDLLVIAEGGSKEGFKGFSEKIMKHPFYEKMRDEFIDMNADETRYLVYGHTHIPEIIPLNNKDLEHVVFNTGTFRPRIFVCADDPKRAGFITHKKLSFAVFYKAGEEQGQSGRQRYEYWEGTLRED